ncbi:alpha/beta hydrolase family protein [Mycobacterium sp. 48b]|uniref:alpha/beta hydrolase family protein n=1 Tax=Mycobacterium sp. 48b TaxID=3400426 RepID=UPI003AACBB61
MRILAFGPERAEQTVLFAAGSGGDPQRYRPLLDEFADRECRVIAPVFDRIDGARASEAELIARPHGLVEALAQASAPEANVAVVGHSIGGWAALCLAGARPWSRAGHAMDVPREPRVSRLVLYAPAAGWFAAPGALDAVTAPMLVYVGELDTVTPAEQALQLKNARADVDLRVVPNAGHFSFMHQPPPGVVEDVAFDRDAFLADLARATLDFVTSG